MGQSTKEKEKEESTCCLLTSGRGQLGASVFRQLKMPKYTGGRGIFWTRRENKCAVGDGWSAPFRLRRRSISRACFHFSSASTPRHDSFHVRGESVLCEQNRLLMHYAVSKWHISQSVYYHHSWIHWKQAKCSSFTSVKGPFRACFHILLLTQCTFETGTGHLREKDKTGEGEEEYEKNTVMFVYQKWAAVLKIKALVSCDLRVEHCVANARTVLFFSDISIISHVVFFQTGTTWKQSKGNWQGGVSHWGGGESLSSLKEKTRATPYHYLIATLCVKVQIK